MASIKREEEEWWKYQTHPVTQLLGQILCLIYPWKTWKRILLIDSEKLEDNQDVNLHNPSLKEGPVSFRVGETR